MVSQQTQRERCDAVLHSVRLSGPIRLGSCRAPDRSARRIKLALMMGLAATAAQSPLARGVEAGDRSPHAQWSVQPATLTPVVVHGTRTAAVEPPWQTTVDRRQLDAQQIRDWSDLSRRAEPGVSFNRRTNSITIRGLGDDRVLTRIDGIRLPWLDDGARGVKGGLEAVDFNSLSRVDIVRGADSSAGGSGALGGLADLRTLDPADLLTDNTDFGALTKIDYDSADTSRGANAALAGRLPSDTSWLLQAGARRGHALDNRGNVGGYGASRTEPSPEHYRQQSFLMKLRHRVNANHRFGLTGERFKRDADIDNMFQQGMGTSYLYGENASQKETTRQRVSLDYAYAATGGSGLIDSAQAAVYWQRMRLDDSLDGRRTTDTRARIIPGDPFRYGHPNGPFGRDNRIQQTIFGSSLSASKQLGDASLAQTWTVGGEWYGTRTEQYSGGDDSCPVMRPGLPAPFGPRSCDMLHTNQADSPKVKGSQWALWIQDDIAFDEGRYALMPALRYDHYGQTPQSSGSYDSNLNARGLPSSSSGGRFSPKLLASWMPVQSVTLYAQYAYGFKAPSATQLYTNYGGPGTYLRVGNPALKPETSKGWELGTKVGDTSQGGAVSFFDNHYQNFIDTNVPLNASSPEWQQAWNGLYPLGVTGSFNRARVSIRGAEARAHWSFHPGWRTWSSLAWAVGKDTRTGQYLNSVAPLKAVLGLAYEQQAWGVNASLTAALRRNKVEYPDATTAAPNADFRAPGYGVVDLQGYWRPSAVKGLQLQAGVFNLLDKKYWDAINVPTAGTAALPRAVDWYTEPGRSVRVSMIYQY